jgi:glycosyltransferase involved in cell wall biosynthesis
VLSEIRRIDARTPVDVVHVPNWDAEGLAVTMDGRFPTSLLVVTPILAVAEYDQRIDATRKDIVALAEAERFSYQNADMMMCCFASTLDELRRLYGVTVPAGKAAMIPLALPDSSTPDIGPAEESVEVLFVGRLEPRKGVDTLLEAIPAVCRRHPDVRFVLAGDDAIPGPDGVTYRTAFERRATAETLARVRFAGPLSDHDLAVVLARCAIFVAPSRFESFGLMNLEAMRFAKPVVSTKVNGISSVVRDGQDGVLVAPGDAAALATAIESLLDDPALAERMGRSGRRRFETTFSVDRMVEQVARAFDRLSGNRRQEATG